MQSEDTYQVRKFFLDIDKISAIVDTYLMAVDERICPMLKLKPWKGDSWLVARVSPAGKNAEDESQ
jgi:hypothetical protein